MTTPTTRRTVQDFDAPPPEIPAVWKRWEPRFIAAGTDSNIIVQLKANIERWDQWCAEWCRVGEDLERFADLALGRGYNRTAGDALQRAALAYHFGGMYLVSDNAGFWDSHDKKLAASARSAPLVDPPASRFTFEFNGVEIPAILRVPHGVERPPVAVLFNGFEGVKEESEGRIAELLARGLATVSWDGPGRGETWEHIPMTGDYGPATSALIDALESRSEVDASRLGAVGPNRGGFVAAKAAATDDRIRAMALTSPGFDRRGTKWEDPYQVAFDMNLFHVESVEELREVLNGDHLTLEGQVPSIKASTLILAGDRDEGKHFEGSQRFYEELAGEKEWMVIEGSERNGNNVPYKIRPLMADFLAEKLRT